MTSIVFYSLVGIVITGTVAIVAIAIYFGIYKTRINKQINTLNAKPQKMMPPWLFAIIIVIVVLVGFSISITTRYMLSASNANRIPDQYYQATYSFKSYSPDEMSQGYRNNFSIESNAGYTKHVTVENDVKFTYFTRNDEYNTYHPSFIVYVEYIGAKHVLVNGLNGKFLTDSEALITGQGWGGGYSDKYFTVLGNASVECIFSLTVYYYDTLEKPQPKSNGDMDMGEGAVAKETLRFIVPPPRDE